MTGTAEHRLSEIEIAENLIRSWRGNGNDPSRVTEKLERVQTILAAENLCRQVPNLAKATELWPDVPKDEKPGTFVYNDLDERVTIATSDDGRRLAIGYTNIALIHDEARDLTFWLESDHDLSHGHFEAADLTRLALFRTYPSPELLPSATTHNILTFML